MLELLFESNDLSMHVRCEKVGAYPVREGEKVKTGDENLREVLGANSRKVVL